MLMAPQLVAGHFVEDAGDQGLGTAEDHQRPMQGGDYGIGRLILKLGFVEQIPG